MAALDELMHGSEAETAAVVTRVRSYLARRRLMRAAAAVLAVLRIQRRVNARRSLSLLALHARVLVLSSRAGRAWLARSRTSLRYNAGATIVAAVFRGRGARRALQGARRAAVTIQCRARVRAACRRSLRAASVHHAALALMLHHARAFLEKARATRMRARCAAASYLQAGARGLAARRVARMVREEKRRVQGEQMQRALEAAREATAALRRAKRAAVAVQACARMRAGRRALAAARDAARRAETAALEARKQKQRADRVAKAEAQRRALAVTLMQSHVRGGAAVRAVARMRAEVADRRAVAAAAQRARTAAARERVVRLAAATALQCAVRCMRARAAWCDAAEVRRTALVQQREQARQQAGARAQHRARHAAATRLQCGVRATAARSALYAAQQAAKHRSTQEHDEMRTRVLSIRTRASGPAGRATVIPPPSAAFAAVRLQARWRAVALARRRSAEKRLLDAQRVQLEESEQQRRDMASAIKMAEDLVRSSVQNRAQLEAQAAELATLRREKEERHNAQSSSPLHSHVKPLSPSQLSVGDELFMPPPPDSPPPLSPPPAEMPDPPLLDTPNRALQLSVRLLKSATRLFTGGRPSPDSQPKAPCLPTHLPRSNRAAQLRMAACIPGRRDADAGAPSPNLITFGSPAARSPAPKLLTPSSRTPSKQVAAASPSAVFSPRVPACSPRPALPLGETSGGASPRDHTVPLGRLSSAERQRDERLVGGPKVAPAPAGRIPAPERKSARSGMPAAGQRTQASRLPKPLSCLPAPPPAKANRPSGSRASGGPSVPSALSSIPMMPHPAPPKAVAAPPAVNGRRTSMLPQPGQVARAGSTGSLLVGPSHLPPPGRHRISSESLASAIYAEESANSGGKKSGNASNSASRASTARISLTTPLADQAEPERASAMLLLTTQAQQPASTEQHAPQRGLPAPRVLVDPSKKLQAFCQADLLDKENETVAAAIHATSGEAEMGM